MMIRLTANRTVKGKDGAETVETYIKDVEVRSVVLPDGSRALRFDIPSDMPQDLLEQLNNTEIMEVGILPD